MTKKSKQVFFGYNVYNSTSFTMEDGKREKGRLKHEAMVTFRERIMIALYAGKDVTVEVVDDERGVVPSEDQTKAPMGMSARLASFPHGRG